MPRISKPAVTTKRSQNGDLTLAVSMGLPSMEPEVWRKDVRRARERIGPGQLLVVSVVGTHAPGGDRDALIEDYARCAAWAQEAGAVVTMPPQDMFWGDRVGTVQDPFGYSWSLATHTKDLTPQELEEGAKAAFARMEKK